MCFVQPFQRRDDFLLADFQRVGDHTRGLFEAEASIAVSAAHALQYVNILIIFRHGSYLICRGKPDSLRRDQLDTGSRLAGLLDDHTDAHKDTPRLFAPENLKYNKCVFRHESWWFIATNQRPKSNLPALLELQRRVEASFG